VEYPSSAGESFDKEDGSNEMRKKRRAKLNAAQEVMR